MGRHKAIDSDRMDDDLSVSKSIIKALDILNQYSEADELGILEISDNTGLPASTVQRIINSLAAKQYLVQNNSNYKYRLGSAFFNISNRYAPKHGWVDLSLSHMKKLSSVYKETVNLGILQVARVILLAKVDSTYILRPNFDIGVAYEASTSALWRCLAAYQIPDIIENLITTVKPSTQRSMTEPEQLRALLAKVKKQGYAIEDEEFQIGLLCIASPIFDNYGNAIAALSISIPKVRLDLSKLAVITKDVCNTAKNISEELAPSL
jgi:IclR family KDG regulon transcriptional repressor